MDLGIDGTATDSRIGQCCPLDPVLSIGCESARRRPFLEGIATRGPAVAALPSRAFTVMAGGRAQYHHLCAIRSSKAPTS